MASLYAKVKKYLEANSKTWEAEENNIILQNDGIGKDYIKTWSVDGLDKPTDKKLKTYESEATKLENNNVIRETRRKLYGNIGDQLDEIFKNIDDWKARIQKIKDDNPKE